MAVHRNLVVDAEDDDWRALAACRSVDANLFFPIGSSGPALGQIQAAKAFCRSCPVHTRVSSSPSRPIRRTASGAARTKLSADGFAVSGASLASRWGDGWAFEGRGVLRPT